MRFPSRLKAGLALALLAASIIPSAAYNVDEIGSFYIGGYPVTLAGLPEQEIKIPGGTPIKVDPNGDYHTGQMYVQFVKLANPTAKYPLLLWHTGGITGASWETKPDGKPGWMQFFLKAGHSVYVSDAVERGRATFSRPEIFKSDPIFRDKRDGWEIFRIGPPGSYRTSPNERRANPGVKFPLDAFDTLQMQMAARWPTTGDATQAAYNALVERVCPCVIVAHGQAGLFAFRASLMIPDKVKGIVAVEPAFAPSANHPEIGRLAKTPHLFVWGDYIDTNPTWIEHVDGLKPYHSALVSKGVPSTWLDLPAEGIKGNTHMPMMDTNSDQVAARVQAWLAKSGLTSQRGETADPAQVVRRTPPRVQRAIAAAARPKSAVASQAPVRRAPDIAGN